ncbi:MAG TPA: twin-arginine translocation signal domain-containing protein [Anaerolineae bacterium]|nr:twin-arginine translocation signal domain-containing protein [Anaerolineae bacterium]
METEFSASRRGQVIERINQRLQVLDYQTLLKLDVLTEQVEADKEVLAAAEITRRRFLQGALVGGVAGLAVGAGGSLVAWETGTAAGRTAAELEAAAEALKLKGLLALYENLEKIGLDAIVSTGVAAVGLLLGGVESGSLALKAGLDSVEGLLLDFEAAFPTIRAGIEWTEGVVTAFADKLQALEDAIEGVLEKAQPVTEALGSFFNFVLDLLPFGYGDKIRSTLDRIDDIVTSIPEAVEGINTKLLEPLRRDWFSEEEGKGLKAGLIDPIVTKLLDPLEAFLGKLAELMDGWEEKLAGPVQKAIGERDAIREQIARYKAEEGLA